MNSALLDPYVRSVLEDLGWTEARRFPLADSWAAEIERDGCPRFDAARNILRSLGGLRIQEHSPASGLYFLERCGGDRSRLEERYRRPLERLDALGLADAPRRYTGASLDFNALAAWQDREIVLDFAAAGKIAGEPLFPAGALEPDGISCVSPSGRIFTLFNDSLFLSGTSAEDYLNICFLKALAPVPLWKAPKETAGNPS